MGKLILVRHGETELNKEKKFFGWLDPELNETGKCQARKSKNTIEKILRDNARAKTYTSPLKRAVETCAIISGKDSEWQVTHTLKEINFGIFEGFSYEEILEKYPHQSKIAFTKWEDYNFETGESPRELQKRVVSFIEREINLGENNIVVSHWGVINSILSYFFSKDLEAYWKFSLKNGGIAVINFSEGFPVLEGFNIGAWDD